MQIELINGHNVICDHILKPSELVVGSRWLSMIGTGRIVVIRDLEQYGNVGEVSVHFGEYGLDRTYEKDSYSFQCRYLLIKE
jgi:hypothetical protein